MEQPHPRFIKGAQEHHFVRVAAGAGHSLALTTSGQVWSFGQGSFGALGTSTSHTLLLLQQQYDMKKSWKPYICQYCHAFAKSVDSDVHVFTQQWQLVLLDVGTQDLKQSAEVQNPKARQQMCNPLKLPLLQLYLNSCTNILVDHSPAKMSTDCMHRDRTTHGAKVPLQVMLYPVGQGDSFASNVPRPLPSLAALGVVQIACGESHNAALTIHGQVFTWGRGKYGALGLGAFDSSSWPQRVTALREPACQVRLSQSLMTR